MQICNVPVNACITCKYPVHGNRNILKNREGRIEAVGKNKFGEEYIKVQLTNGTFRTFSANRIVNLQVVA